MTQEEVNIIELQSSTTLCDGKYTIEAKIGEGGFGITYKAIQNGLNRVVCIKEYFPTGKCTRATKKNTVFVQGTSEQVFEKYRQAFVREAKMLAKLHHPNIVEILDVFDENNTSYMVMPFIEGTSLQNMVEKKGPLHYTEAINYIGQISNAIDFIHKQHILHRDIKPDNIMITSDYKAILIDFGNAREFEHDKTQMHTSIFTRCYAPLEQYEVNSRKGSYTDIYALGATLYFVLTGVEPMESASRIIDKMKEPKEILSNIPDAINRTIMKAMQLKPEHRHQMIKDFMDDLLNVRPSTIIDETIGKGYRKKKMLLFILIIIAVVVSSVILSLFFIFNKETEKIVETKDFTEMGIYPMIEIEGGSFMMGNSEEDDAVPHNVELSSFYIGQYEVSRDFWFKIMKYDNSEYPALKDINPKTKTQYTKEEIGSFPVTDVSYEEVCSFIQKLNKKTGQCFMLPTEAQWEYVARGGRKNTHKMFSVPKNVTIWYDKDHPISINSFIPNDLGVYHMSGNVAEWCRDFYDYSFYEESYLKDPINENVSDSYVVRGGSFEDNDISDIKIYYRASDDRARSYIGFRLVTKK